MGESNSTSKSASKGSKDPEDALAAGRELLQALSPLNLVMLTRERLQESLNHLVERGRMTARDAEDLLADLVARSRRETEELFGTIESAAGEARRIVQSSPAGEKVLRTADRARRRVPLGPSFPIIGYDDLTAAKIVQRLPDLTPPELRKVRDHEKRHGNRKSVLEAIEKALR